MFLANQLSKINYFVVGLIVLSSLPSVELSVGRPFKIASLYARPPPIKRSFEKSKVPIHCSKTFGTHNQFGVLSCRDNTNQGYSCQPGQCHYGSADDSPDKFPLDKMVFEDYDQKTIIVKGYDKNASGNPNGNTEVLTYKCHWDKMTDTNTLRPWCGSCYREEWKEPTPEEFAKDKP
ncbi:hypothetical protein H4Q26_013467 [Puccinia striiformis f. sp. tritici PST-130]|nr:hypothetical protein H4Q26_013467 [Puccinia striiformis f. sp. tritici PST-130]